MARKSKRTMMSENNTKANENIYSTAVYIRLSVEDTLYKHGTESLENQRDLIFDYIKDKPDMKIYSVYCDNGESGTNFERKGFQKMMCDVYNGNVNCIIVKDLSRFGREYIEAGDYLERIFPLLGIRFIAINDHYDNHVNPFNISVPIKNIINTLYARDLSKKSAVVRRIKQVNGEFVGTYPAYGYIKSPEDKHKLIIDDEAADVVRMIFEWKAERMGNAAICQKLYDMNISPPVKYRYDKGIVKSEKYASIKTWRTSTVKKMLENETYIGNMVQGRKKSRFYDGGKLEYVDKSEWIVVRNTHEPIVSKEVFYKVQKILEDTNAAYYRNLGKYDKISNKDNLFKGKIVCGDCGTRLTRYKLAKPEHGRSDYSYICPFRSRFPKLCSFVSIKEEQLKEIVINSIRLQLGHLTKLDIMLEEASKSNTVRKKIMANAKETSDIISEIACIKSGRIRVAAEYARDILSEDEYVHIQSQFDVDLKKANERMDLVEKQREKINRLFSAQKWVRDIKKYKGSKSLTKEMVDAFIKCIKVYCDKRIEIEWIYTETDREHFELIGADKPESNLPSVTGSFTV